VNVRPIPAWTNGLGRVLRAPALVLVLWLCSLAITIPPAIALNDAIGRHLGSSIEADNALNGTNYDWLQEFRAQASPLGRSLRTDVIGFAAVLDNASALADVNVRSMVVIVAAIVFAGVIWFLSPGIICRLAVDTPLGAGPILGIAGTFGFRMAKLGVVAAAAYGALFMSVHAWLFDDVFDRMTREVTVERTAFFLRLTLYVLFFLLVAAVNAVFDFARVRTVVEDRRSTGAAIAAAARFIRNNARTACGVYLLNVASVALVVGVYAVVVPGAGGGEWNAWYAFIVGQMYVAARLAVKLAFWSSEIAALQGRFDCPGFVRGVSGTSRDSSYVASGLQIRGPVSANSSLPLPRRP
jgi:hypothetical protein